MLRVYNQNIWGNMPKEEAVANRNQLVRSLIRKYQPDFCTLQECNPSTSRLGTEGMQELLKEAYSEAAPEDWHRNFTPVFYRRDRFRLIDSGFMPFEGLNDGNSKSVTWGVFEEISTGKSVGIASTHFWFKHLSQEDTKQRVENGAALKRICDDMIRKYQVPVIAAGDLNNGSNTSHGEDLPYRTMLAWGFKDIRFTADKSTDSPTIHHYPVRNEQGLYAEADMPVSTIDYIFTYGENVLKAERFQVLTEHDALVSSDHCPLVGDFIF